MAGPSDEQCESPEVLGDGGQNKLILGASWTTQSKSTKLENALQMREPHLDLLALQPWSFERLGAGEGSRHITSDFVPMVWSLAKRDLGTALRPEFAASQSRFQPDRSAWSIINKCPRRRQDIARQTVVDIFSRIISKVAAREGAVISL